MRARITYANVVSTLALFVALGGAGYAAGVVPLAAKARFADRAAYATKAGAAVKAGTAGAAAKAGTAVAAAFALNARTVDHLSAARSPRPHALLALDGAGRFPAAVVPAPAVVERTATGKGFAAAFCRRGEIVTGGGGAIDSGVVVSSGPHRGNRGNLVGWAVRSSDSAATVTSEALCSGAR